MACKRYPRRPGSGNPYDCAVPKVTDADIDCDARTDVGAISKPYREDQKQPPRKSLPDYGGVRGTITSISGSKIPAEEDPSSESGSPKGFFTMADGTEIFRQRGDGLVPASLSDVQVGH